MYKNIKSNSFSDQKCLFIHRYKTSWLIQNGSHWHHASCKVINFWRKQCPMNSCGSLLSIMSEFTSEVLFDRPGDLRYYLNSYCRVLSMLLYLPKSVDISKTMFQPQCTWLASWCNDAQTLGHLSPVRFIPSHRNSQTCTLHWLED